MGAKRRRVEENLVVRIIRPYLGLRKMERHGLILVVAGFIYVLIGVSYVISKGNPSRDLSLKVLLTIAPMQFWGGAFIFAGFLAMISSRWPPFADTWGYIVLTSLSVSWAGAYLTGIIFAHAPWSNINGTLAWSLIGFMWWAISGLVNPGVVVVRNEDRPA